MQIERNNEPFVHVLLFECVRCGGPVPLAATSDAKNLEELQSRTLDLHCITCGWSGMSDGFAAKRHWVDKWRQ
jgi:hypothetical protein